MEIERRGNRQVHFVKNRLSLPLMLEFHINSFAFDGVMNRSENHAAVAIALYQIILRAPTHRLNRQCFVLQGGDDDDWQSRRRILEPQKRFYSVRVRKRQVKQHEVERRFPQTLQGIGEAKDMNQFEVTILAGGFTNDRPQQSRVAAAVLN
jgi:hypothetical protein